VKAEKDDFVYVNVSGNLIQCICHKESQQQRVIDRMIKPGNCVFEGYEVWEGDKVILTFRLLDYPDIKPSKN
tara:strand:- start:326 stop:541 length:216 start_codon:yes stop_codon:yes gene_type:complete